MQARLAARLRAAGFALEDRPFAPHLTLARRIERALPRAEVEPVRWRLASVALVRSEPGTGRYVTQREFALAGA